MPRSGAPALLDRHPQIAQEIVTLLRGGNYIETAAAIAGVSAGQARAWIRRGRQSLRRLEDGLEVLEGDRVYREFAIAVNAAIAVAEAKDLRVIEQAAEGGDWKAAAWRLQRRHPARWGRQVHEVGLIDGPADAGAEAVEEMRSDEKGREALELLYRRMAGIPGDDGDASDEVESAEDPMASGAPPLAGE